MNRYVLSILRAAAGLESSAQEPAREFHDLDHLFSTWTQEEYEAFEIELAAQRQIDLDWGLSA